jgi:hypothetical protein
MSWGHRWRAKKKTVSYQPFTSSVRTLALGSSFLNNPLIKIFYKSLPRKYICDILNLKLNPYLQSFE